ncbi:DUF6086 family protein [Actinomadura welshii]
MSQFFQNGDDVLWNPATRVAQVFMDMAAAHARLLGTPSGLGPMEADECEVDVAAFAAFTDALVRYYAGSNHPVLRSLMEGFVATALAVVRRGGGDVPAADGAAVRHLVELSHRHEAAMPR